MGWLRLWELAKLMLYGGFERFIRLEAVVLFDSQFCFVVYPFGRTKWLHERGPTQLYLARGPGALFDFPTGSD